MKKCVYFEVAYEIEANTSMGLELAIENIQNAYLQSRHPCGWEEDLYQYKHVNNRIPRVLSIVDE